MRCISKVRAFEWISDKVSPKAGFLRIIDQLKLPNTLQTIDLHSVEDVARAIETMQVRGAPAIGIVAAFGMLYAVRELEATRSIAEQLNSSYERLASTRPTAVNLFWALDRMKRVLLSSTGADLESLAYNEAMRIWEEDVLMNEQIAEHGANAIGEVKNILTHCNAGALATGGLGTALGVIRCISARMKQKSRSLHVWVDETRPYLQGARLTAWELMQDGINLSLIADNMAAYFMQRGEVDAVIIGADRIVRNGDVANKIGSYALSVLARHHGIPFYVAAPKSSFDTSMASMSEIPIEERSRDELTMIAAHRIAPEGVGVRHPAFDLTPGVLITGIITEEGVYRAPYHFV
ncbi:MAG: S-methyl-5-thioribose-1-phosphate isomerase [Bradymonadales bacterium]